MDKREWIGAISLSVAIAVLWLGFVKWYEHKYPPVVGPPVAAQTPTTEPAVVTPTTTVASTNPATGPTTNVAAAPPTMSAGVHVVASTQPSAGPIVLGSEKFNDPNYVMQLSLQANGAGVSDVVLNQFAAPDGENKSGKEPKKLYRYQEPIPNHGETEVLATRSLIVDDKTIDLWNVDWNLDSSDSSSAAFSVIIDDGAGNHLAQITKTFSIDKRSNSGNRGYEVAVHQSIKNLRTDRAIKVHAIVNGPTSPPAEGEQGADRSIVVGFNEAGKSISVETHAESDFKQDNPEKDLTYNDKLHFAWAGQASSYFGALVLPGDKPGSADLTVHGVALDPAAGSDADHHLTLMFQTGDVSLAPGAQATLPMTVYFGPKWREVLETPHYEGFPRMYHQLLEIKSRLCGWATSEYLISGLVWVLEKFHALFKDWGLAIICLVLIVRTLLHPITKRSQMQMMKMGKLSPEVEKLKKKYADQPDVLNREMMKLYKQQGGAILGCLPMFLQTPIWIALWSGLQGTFELRQAPFLYGWTWIHDLAKPDMLFHFNQPIPLLLFGWHLRAINILPLAMAVVTYVNQKYFMPTPIAATPEQEQQQKMQRGMSLLFPLMFYSLPSGLNLYYLTSMSLGIVESKIIRDHMKEQEELAKEQGPEIVATKATRNKRDGDGGVGAKNSKTPPGKPGLMDRLMEAMRKAQEEAERMRREKDKGKGKGK